MVGTVHFEKNILEPKKKTWEKNPLEVELCPYK